jgi:hypothetical protein
MHTSHDTPRSAASIEAVVSHSSCANVIDLLCTYRTALGLTNALPASRRLRWRWALRFVSLLRPTWGLQRFAVEHVRQRVEQLSRCYSVRLALGEDDSNEAHHREALERFAGSLPARPGPARRALLLLAIVLVAQLQVATTAIVSGEGGTFNQILAITDLNPSHASQTIDVLIHTSIAVLLDLIGGVALAVYLVLRPFVNGYRLKRLLFYEPGALRGSAARSPLGRAASELGVHEREVAMFGAIRHRARLGLDCVGGPTGTLVGATGLGAQFDPERPRRVARSGA